MAVTMQTADQALKIYYLGVVQNQLNVKTDPLFNKIQSSTENVYGKEIRKMAPYGVNGGIGAGTEISQFPVAGGNNYANFVLSTKNLYGNIEISDKSIKASSNNAGAFVNLLNNELKGLMEGSKFNLSRQLFGDGKGLLSTCGTTTASNTVVIEGDMKYFMEGQTVDIVTTATGVPIANGTARRIVAVDRAGKKIVLNSDGAAVTTDNTMSVTMQGSYNLEITGLAEIFKTTGSLYGIDRTANYWMVPYIQGTIGIISDIKIQKMIDTLDETAGSTINYLCCSSGVKRSYQEYLEATKRNVNTLNLEGGFTAISYNGIPLVSNKFAQSGTLMGLNTSDLTFNHMGDWDWMTGNNGQTLQQVPNFPIWRAQLVRYADLTCDHPAGQGLMTGISEDDGTV